MLKLLYNSPFHIFQEDNLWHIPHFCRMQKGF